MSKCQLEEFNGCCCKCTFQEKVMRHPWNISYPFTGKISESFGWGCMMLIAMREKGESKRSGVIFKESEHGMCEMFNRIK